MHRDLVPANCKENIIRYKLLGENADILMLNRNHSFAGSRVSRLPIPDRNHHR